MALTILEKFLIACFKKYGLSREDTQLFMIYLENEEKQKIMADWIKYNPVTTRHELFTQVRKIAGVIE